MERGAASAPTEARDESQRGGVEAWLSVARALLGAALVLGLSTTVAWAARRHVLTSPRFAVDDIVVTGGHLRSDDTLAAEAGVFKGMNIFSLDVDRARARLLHDPWVASAVLSRRLPGRVFLQVTERELGAIVALPETYLAGRDGHLFKRFEAGDPSDVPVITGLTSDAAALDREGVERSLGAALDLASDYEHAPLAARAPLQEVHVTNGGELTLVIGKDGVSVALGQAPFRRKLDELARIFAELDRRGEHASLLMLDDEARPDRVVVRTR